MYDQCSLQSKLDRNSQQQCRYGQMDIVTTLLANHSIISDQVNKQDLTVILGELEKTLDREITGDVVEFGCYKGTTSLFIRRLLDVLDEDREFHVYDSFEGLPEKSREDSSVVGSDFKAGQLAASKKQFIREFRKAKLQLPLIHKSWFDRLTPADVPEQIAFVFLDGDFYESIKTSLQLVLPRMSKGSVIVIHDYAREALPGVVRAVSEAGLRTQSLHGLGIVRY